MFETWARDVVGPAGDTVFAALAEAQRPRLDDARIMSRVRPGCTGRWLHFRHPDSPEQRAVWLVATVRDHAYNVRGTGDCVGAWLTQDTKEELAQRRMAARLQGSFDWSWRRHIDGKHEGWRLTPPLPADAEHDDASAVADALATRVLAALRKAKLVG